MNNNRDTQSSDKENRRSVSDSTKVSNQVKSKPTDEQIEAVFAAHTPKELAAILDSAWEYALEKHANGVPGFYVEEVSEEMMRKPFERVKV